MPDSTWESFKAEGADVLEKIKELIRKGNVRRVVIEHIAAGGRKAGRVAAGCRDVVVAAQGPAVGRLAPIDGVVTPQDGVIGIRVLLYVHRVRVEGEGGRQRHGSPCGGSVPHTLLNSI